MEDVTLRALRLLRTARVIAAEDTRVARRLLAGLGIRPAAKLLSLRAHNEMRAATALFAAVGENEHAVYVADAGTPAISDPGGRLARLARAAGLSVSPVPGASALTALLAVGGAAEGCAHFFGFPPRTANRRRDFFLSLRRLDGCAVFFESPRRVGATLVALADAFGGERRAVLGREMTKLHEQIVDADLDALVAAVAAGEIPQRGEFSLLVELPGDSATAVDAEKLFSLLAAELPPRRAAAVAARATGADSAALYRAHLARRGDARHGDKAD